MKKFQKIHKLEDIKELITGFHSLRHIKSSEFLLELEVIKNTSDFVNKESKPIIENRVFLLVCD